MKIGLVCSHGGHLSEMLLLSRAVEDHEIFYITSQLPRMRVHKLKNEYLMENIGTSILRMIKGMLLILRIFLKEKPDMIISTGSEVAISAFYLAKVLGIKTVFIESYCRIKTCSLTARIVYPIADVFIVQWKSLLEKYGEKAQFLGAVL